MPAARVPLVRRPAPLAAALVLGGALALPAQAALDLPSLRAGLWEMSTSSNRAPGIKTVSTLCLDASLQQDMLKMASGMMAGVCSKSEMKNVGGTYVGEATCSFGGSTMKSKSTMKMSGDTSYRTEAHASFDPPYAGMTTTDTVVEGRHVGACKAGQKPGDMTLPNGQTINIRNAIAGKK